MALNVATGVVAKDSSGTNGATQDINIGFAGKAVILWASSVTSQDSFAGSAEFGFGFSDGTDAFSAAIIILDGQATSYAKRRHALKALTIQHLFEKVDCSATFVGGDTLRLTWDDNDTLATLIHYLVLGGDDLTNAKVINTFEASTTVQSQDRTGFGFDPDFLLFTHDDDDTDPPVGDAIALLHIGAIADKASRYELMAFMGSEDAAAAANNETHLADDASTTRTALMGQALKTGTFITNGIAAVTFITDGYNANWTSAASAAWHYGVLALKGLQYDLERDLCPTSTGDDSLTGFGFQPEALLTFMSPVASGFEGDGDINLGIGAATSTADEHAAWVGDNDAADPTEVDQRSTATYMVLGAAPGTPTVDKQASLVEFLSDGFKQNWATVPATAHYQGWIAFGPAAATGNRSPAFAQII